MENGNRLERSLGWFPLTSIVVANMIGAGIFTTSGLLMNDLQNPLLMIGLWAIGGLLAFCGALSYGELGRVMPAAGGEYVFLSRLYHPLLGFLSGWVSFVVGFSAPIAASALGFSEYVVRAFPAPIQEGAVLPLLTAAVTKKVLATAVILVFSAVHMRGLSLGARVQNVLTLLKVGLILTLLIVGFAFGSGDWTHFQSATSIDSSFSGWKRMGLSLMWIMFGYSGWNASVYIGSEIARPKRNVPLSLMAGTAIVVIIYLALNALYVYAVPPAEMSGVISIGGLAMGKLFSRSMDVVFSLLISFALFSSLSAFIILGPRVYYAMAQKGHFFSRFAQVHPKYKVPSAAIFLQAIVSIFMVLSGTFDQILTYMGFSLGIFPLLAVFAVFLLKHRGEELKMPGYPWAQLFYILFSLAILVLAYFQRPIESSIAVGTVLVGIPVFYLINKSTTKREV